MSQTDPTPAGWPDAERPGYPANPHQDGAHLVNDHPWLWNAINESWVGIGGGLYTGDQFGSKSYLIYDGPCLTPDEHAAEIAAAVQAEREACALAANEYRNGNPHAIEGMQWWGPRIASAIRARGTTEALDRTEVGVREAIQDALETVVLSLAFYGRDGGTSREANTMEQLVAMWAATDTKLRAALALLPTPASAETK
jgi:hypothetical protein